MEQLGRYRIEEVLGRGAMGTVYRAYDPKIDRVVAIKMVNLEGVAAREEDEYRRRFSSEARAAGKLSHAGVVAIHDVGEQEGTKAPYLVMEYVEGATLESLISNAKETPIPGTIDLIKQVADALDYAHSQGVVHRDIKPANIIITPDGRAKIADFGIAKLAVTQLTMPGEAIGTPSYMSPEQITAGDLDGRSDLFSLGIILYTMLAGQKPFTGDSPTSVMFNIAYKEPLPVRQLDPSLDPQLGEVVGRALAKRPEDRYQSGKEFSDDLENIAQKRVLRTCVVNKPQPDDRQTVVLKRSQPLQTVSLNTAEPPKQAGLIASLTQAFQRMPESLTWVLGNTARKTQLALAAVAFSLALLVLGSIAPAKTARLEVRCVHNFATASLRVWLDEELAYEAELTGTVRKRLRLIKSVQGNFVDTFAATPGNHVIRVQVTSKTAGYDQTKEIRAELMPESNRRLEIGFAGRGENLNLELK